MKRLRRSVIVLSGFLLLALPTNMPAQGMPLTRAEIGSLLGSQSTFDREEVIDLLLAVVAMADEEIRRTSEEAVKAAVLDLAPTLARERTIAEEWRSEAQREKVDARILKGVAVVEAICIGVLGAILGAREVTR